MKYTHTYSTLWHDTDASRVVRAGRIQMYLQETGDLQCKSYGIPLDRLRDERGVGFILSKIALKVYKPIGAHEEIKVSTWCTETKGYSFHRFFDIECGGEVVARASSLWALMDVRSHALVRGNDELASHFPYDAPIPPEELPLQARIGRSQVLERVGVRTVGYSDIDYNMHMNNTRYPDMLCDFLPCMQGKYVSEMSISYIKEAPLGAVLEVFRGPGDGGEYLFRAQRDDGEVCVEAMVKVLEIGE